MDLASGEWRLRKRQEVPGYDPAGYRTQRITATAQDGTAIPVTIAYRAGLPRDGSAPVLLYGYGAYESCEWPEFSLPVASLLDRGYLYAVAHVRGGGEGGRRWWLQGRLDHKRTTFTDFIAVADALAAGKWVAGDAIVSRGLSAGGLLQGAVYSMAPRRWRAVVAEVPFVDVVNSMLDPTIPLTINEWDEWGDPRGPAMRAYMESYSPYDNPPAGPRPDLLVTGSLHDPRVLVHEPAKWVARLRATSPTGAAGRPATAGCCSGPSSGPGRTWARPGATTSSRTRPRSSRSSWTRPGTPAGTRWPAPADRAGRQAVRSSSAAIASTPAAVASREGLSAVGQVDSFATTVWDGPWTKICCPLMPEAW